MKHVKLGLIGDNIMSSSAPRLHQIAAAQLGLNLTYDLIIPAQFGFDFDQAFDHVRLKGYSGVNITLPYKETAFRQVTIDDPAIHKLGSVNTVCFQGENMSGFNTDYTGFLKSYQSIRGDKPVGSVLLIGAGGVGRSIAFGLMQLGATHLAIIDKDPSRAVHLADELNTHMPGIAEHIERGAISTHDAVINCSPSGMYGYGGLPLPEEDFPHRFEWAFDAVYQPVNTPFKQLAESRKAEFISGFELFFHQGVDAFLIFTGHEVNDHAALRKALVASLPQMETA